MTKDPGVCGFSPRQQKKGSIIAEIEVKNLFGCPDSQYTYPHITIFEDADEVAWVW